MQSFFFPLFWGVSQPDVFVQHLQAGLGHVAINLHCADNFVTWGRNNSMLSDGAFVAAWQASAQTDADKAIAWRRYILACAAFHRVHLDGRIPEAFAQVRRTASPIFTSTSTRRKAKSRRSMHCSIAYCRAAS